MKCGWRFTVWDVVQSSAISEWFCPHCGGTVTNQISPPLPPSLSLGRTVDNDDCPPAALHPFACPLARTFVEDRYRPYRDTRGTDAENAWLARFGEAIDLLDELFQGKLGPYPPFKP